MKTKDGLMIYDINPFSEVWVIAGPEGYDVKDIDPHNLPEGFRWVNVSEWNSFQI